MSLCGCQGERSTLPRRPLQRDLRHVDGGSAESGPDITLIGLGRGRQPTRDAFRRFDLRPCGRSRLTRAPFYVRPRYAPYPFHPLRIGLPRQGMPPHQATPRLPHVPFDTRCMPCGTRGLRGEDASTQLLQPTLRHEHPANRSTPESPPPPAFASGTGFHGRPPSLRRANDVTSGKASLDGEPLASARLSMSSSHVSVEDQRHPTCRPLIEDLPGGAPSPWRVGPKRRSPAHL
jgi:hypothetical protein